MVRSLLTTKTYLPAPQPHLVSRPRLKSRLDAGRQNRHRLILLSAPAGSGKSTLLADWAARIRVPLAWLALDPDDNDPVRFWTYVLTAIQTARADVCQSLLEELGGMPPPSLSEFLPSLINELAALADPLVLVLDDYHLIESVQVHENVAFLLDHLPPNLQLVLATRTDPPLHLHRWRARNQLTELRSADLRFTLDEAAALLNEEMKLNLSAADIQLLEERTEGWAVGLQLAALSTEGQADRSTFIAHFSGSHHFVLDYLTGEVLSQQTETVQDFLLQTSLLDRFCGPLCQAVTDRADSDAILEILRRRNLFLIPLDEEGYWFRYHHLFAELLRLRVVRKGEESVRPLHQRAAEWLAANDLVDQALYHALAAHNVSFAADLILANSPKATNEGRLQDVRRWIQLLPPEQVEADPRLSFEFAIALYFLGQTEGAERALANATRALADQGGLQDDYAFASLSGQLAAMRAVIAMRIGQLDTARAQAQEALRLSPPQALLAHSLARVACAVIAREEGQIEEAIRAHQEALAPLRASRNIMGLAMAYWDMGRLNQIQGRLHRACTVLRECLAQAAELGRSKAPSFGLIHIGLGHVDYEWNDLDGARASLKHGLEQGRRGGHIDLVRQAGLLEARLRRADGDLPGALDALGETLAAVQRADVPLSIADVPAWIARYQAEAGQLEAARRWAESLLRKPEHNPSPAHGIELFSQVRIWMALERWDEALDLARQLEHYALAGGSIGRQIEALLMQALIEQRRDLPTALARLEACLRQAEPEGYVRLFVDEGESAKALLSRFGAAGVPEPRLASFVRRLLQSFPKPIPTHSINTFTTRGAVALSNRELEVLGLMSELMSNPEIAHRLVISPGTVKTHVSHIYDKLGVEGRAEAVAKAKELGII